MDFEYEGSEDYGGRILWPRIGVFLAAAILVFLFGRCTGGGGVPQSQVTALEQENQTLTAANEQLTDTVAVLQDRLAEAAQSEAGGVLPGSGTETPVDPASPGAPTAPAGPPQAGVPYVVQPGDTLTTIAEAVYGDGGAFGIIADANGITSSNPLQIGQELTIPPNPDAT